MINTTLHVPTNSFVSELKTDIGFLHIIANHHAITRIQFSDEPLSFRHQSGKRSQHEDQQGSHAHNDITLHAKAQLEEYFEGKRTRFDMPLSANGTEFQKRVWQALMHIEHGATASYLDIAKKIHNEKACRAVGAANGKNPIAIVVPCHRVIGANGSLTGYAGGMSRKSYLLALESSNAIVTNRESEH